MTPELTAFYTWYESSEQKFWLLKELKEAFLAGYNAGAKTSWKQLELEEQDAPSI